MPIIYFLKVIISSFPFFLCQISISIPRSIQTYFSRFLPQLPHLSPFYGLPNAFAGLIKAFLLFQWSSISIDQLQSYKRSSSKLEMLKQKEQWIQIAKSQHKYIVFFQEKVIDITNFIMVHPGGKKDITDLIFKVYPHDKESTIRKLNQLIIGHVTSRSRSKTTALKNGENSPLKEKKKVCFEDRKRSDHNRRHKTNELNTTTKKSSKKSQQNYHTPSKNKAQEVMQLTAEEKKKKRFNVSIKLLDLNTNDEVIEDKFKDWEDQPRINEKMQAHRSQEDLDEAKPILKLRCLQVKHMNSLENEHLHDS